MASGTSKPDAAGGNYPVYGSTGVIGYTEHANYEGPAILVARVGANAGKLNVVAGRYGVTDNTIIIRLRSDCYLPFVWRQLDKKNLNRLVFGSGQPLITGTQLKALEIAEPSAEEQRAIAEALSDVDALLEASEALIAKKSAIKHAAMQELLTGKVRLPGFRSEWRDASIGQVISRFATGLNPRQNFRLNAGGALFYVTIKNFSQGRLDLSEQCDLIDEAAFRLINARADLRKGDILFASIGRVGDAYLITETPTNWNINESVFALRPDIREVVPLMMLHLLTSKAVKDALEQGATGSTFSSIKQADLKRIKCRLPSSLEEQSAIATVLSDMDAEIAALQARRDKTHAIKQGMMQQLLSGRVRLVNPTSAKDRA